MPDIPAWIALIGIAVVTGTVKLIHWTGGMDRFKSSVEETMQRIEQTITTIQNDIKSILRSLPPKPFVSESPLRLTDLGREISGEVQAREWANVEGARLLDQLRGRQPYEIQEYCFDYVNEHFMRIGSRENLVKLSAYNHGLEVDQVLRVVGIEFRDVLLTNLDLDVPD